MNEQIEKIKKKLKDKFTTWELVGIIVGSVFGALDLILLIVWLVRKHSNPTDIPDLIELHLQNLENNPLDIPLTDSSRIQHGRYSPKQESLSSEEITFV